MATVEKPIAKPRRIGRWLLIGGMVLLAGLYALRAVIFVPYAIGLLERTAAANLGLQLSIGHLGGSIFTNLEVQNVTTVKRLTDTPLADLAFSRLKLQYHPWDLLRGIAAFAAGAAIDIDGARLALDLTGQSDDGTGNQVLKQIYLPPALPRIDIRASAFQIKGPDYETRFNGISLAARG